MQRTDVIGAAGTGKTHLLIESVARLLETKELEASGHKVLILTSSSVSANYIASRLKNVYLDDAIKIPAAVHTVRSLCEDVLKNKDPQVQILSDFRAWFILRECIRAGSAPMQSSYAHVKDKRSFVREMLELIEATSINSISLDELPGADQASDKLEDIKSIDKHYKEFCHQRSLLPAFDVIPRVSNLLNEYGQQFSHIFIDQYEDMCPGEIQAIELLSGDHANVTIFMDAVRCNIEEIEDAKTLDPVHGRPSKGMADHVNRLLGKVVYSGCGQDARAPGGVLTVAIEETAVDEAEYIARIIRKEISGAQRRYSDFAILCSDVERLEKPIRDALRKYSIPCSGNVDISRDPVAQFALLCFQVAAQPGEDDVVLKWLSTPIARLDRADVYRAHSHAKRNRQELLNTITKETLFRKSGDRLKELLSILDFIRGELQSDSNIWELVTPILVKSGIVLPPSEIPPNPPLRKGGTKPFAHGLSEGKMPRAVALLIQIIRDIEETYEKRKRLPVLLDDIRTGLAKISDTDEFIWEDDDAVRIMSIWESRGLEFPFVLIPGMVSDFFPARHPARQLLYGEDMNLVRTALSRVNLPGTISPNRWRQQEKQRFYVAMTRAKEKLYLTLANQYPENSDCEPSPFLADLLEGKEITADNCAQYGIEYQDHTISNPIGRLPALDNIVSRSDLELACYRYVRELERMDQQEADKTIEFLSVVGNLRRPVPMENAAVPQLASQKFSHTSVRSFLSCPRRYFLSHRLRLRAKRQPGGTQFGKLVHDVLRIFHKEYPRLCDHDLAKLWEDMRRMLNKMWEDETEAEFAGNRLQARSYIRLAGEVLWAYLQAEYDNWDEERSCTSVEHEFDFRFLDKYNLTGRMDRIDAWPLGGSEIIDFKTSAFDKEGESALKSRFLNLDDRLDYQPEDYQLPIYYFAGQEFLHRDPERLVIYQLRNFSRSTGFPFRRELEIMPDEDVRSDKKDKFLTKADLESVKDDILITLSGMASGFYPPEPRESNVCERECDFSFLCDREENDSDDS